MCGISSIIPFNNSDNRQVATNVSDLDQLTEKIADTGWKQCFHDRRFASDRYLGGHDTIERLQDTAGQLKRDAAFYHLFADPADYQKVDNAAARLEEIITAETAVAERQETALLDAAAAETAAARLEKVRDIQWRLKHEVCGNIARTRELVPPGITDRAAIVLLKNINAIFNSLDRLEVRGRDSAGLSILFSMTGTAFERFLSDLKKNNLEQDFRQRCDNTVLANRTIRVSQSGEGAVAVALVYKYAAEIGRLGDNVRFLRKTLSDDSVFHGMLAVSWRDYTLSSHTRWASVGTITEANCHPLDHITSRPESRNHIIHVCLNGDIDNYRQLKSAHEADGDIIDPEITTDTKIIPVRLAGYLRKGHDVAEAFRLAVNDFSGAHAISMHTDLAPGKMFFAQKGSGQALFIGLAEDHYIVSSELYGIVEETSRFIKMNAGGTDTANDDRASGQIVILDQVGGGLGGISAMLYDGAPVTFREQDIRQTEITSRDVDRQGYTHYFLKEISEAPLSIEKTLRHRWQARTDNPGVFEVRLSPAVIPGALTKALKDDAIRRIFFIGQGTAGVAALAGADILNYYLADPTITVRALKSSELSGFNLAAADQPRPMSDTLVVAVSQSGTTADTNRAVDMVRNRGAHTMAIVNRRDSDITFKTDGVFYTSTGRDVEMSVASTKAFYSQVVAAAVLGLYIASLKAARSPEFISGEIRQLSRLPATLRKIFTQKDDIRELARQLAASRSNWAIVGSGPNKASADEIRIKLSELCYKTIPSDFVEDKKHIDLSAEPLIIICAAGSRAGVLDDIIKDTAIFRAHKAVPVVIADEGEDRFTPYAAGVISVPQTAEHFGPIVNTFAGHLWGYYAALAINEGSRMLHDFREEIRQDIAAYRKMNLNDFEIVLENGFREKIIDFYHRFRAVRKEIMASTGATLLSDIVLLLKYLAGRLPLSDFKSDFGRTGTAPNMLGALFEFIDVAVNQLARPIDAIKHQAKTVTVGTSRVAPAMEGILFDALAAYGLSLSQLTNSNVVVLQNLQGIIAGIRGAILYEVDRLNLLGEPTEETTIKILKKNGLLARFPSRVETDNRLQGTKKIIVREGNVYVGRGRKDDRSIVVIPVLSVSAAAGGMIRYILLLNIAFKTDAALFDKKKALGGKCEHIKNIVQENSVAWQDNYLELIDIKELFGLSAEKIAEAIVARVEAGKV